MGKFDYVEVSLSIILRHFIEDGLIGNDWTIVSIDQKRDKVVFKRYVDEESKE